MRYKLIAVAAIILAVSAFAKEPRTYQSGTLLQMDSVQCGVREQDASSFAGETLASDPGHKKTQELLCQEYVLQTDRVIFRIQPRDTKHPILLPVGEQAQFRIEKDNLLLRVEGLDGKEREYIVISMTPRGESTADALQVRPNHLQ